MKKTWLLILSVSLAAYGQDRRLDQKRIYQLPNQVITGQDIASLGGLAPDAEIEKIKGLLDKYNSQFTDTKRIWQERNEGPRYNPRLEYNEVRLLARRISTAMAEAGVKRDSEILFNLYTRMARLYEDKKEAEKAASLYLAAFQFRDLSDTESHYMGKNIPSEKQNQDAHSGAKTALEKLVEEKKKLEDAKYLIEARKLRGKLGANEYNAAMTALSARLASIDPEIETAQNNYNDSLQNRYGVWKKNKNETDTGTLYSLARLTKELESKNKDRLKILNNNNLGKGVFLIYDYRENRDFRGYRGFLELAHRISPENQDIIYDLAEEYRTSGNMERSVDMFVRFIALREKENNRDDKYSNALLRTGSLYMVLKKNVKAGDYYKRYMVINGTDKLAKTEAFHMAEFYEFRIGDLGLARTLYSRFLEQAAGSTDPVEQKQVLNARVGLSKFHRFDHYPDREMEELEKAWTVYENIKKLYSARDEDYNKMKADLLKLKTEMFQRSDTDSLARYKLAERKMASVRAEAEHIKTQLQTVRKPEMLERLCILAENKRDYSKALFYLKEFVRTGNEFEINIALKNINRIEKIKKDGILRTPVPFWSNR